MCIEFFFEGYVGHRDVHGLTHSFPTRRSSELLFDVYGRRLPASIVSGAHFDQWWKQARRETPDVLTFELSMLTNDAAGEVTESDFPAEWDAGPSSEEHTYELQSLMRISYDVFCL